MSLLPPSTRHRHTLHLSIKLVVLLFTSMFVHRNTLEPSVLDNHIEHQGMKVTVPYSLDWIANSGVWDSRNLKVRDLSHSKLKIPTSWM